MGFPGEGLQSFYRNNKEDVIKFFAIYHDYRVKIYNLCNDKSINVNILRIKCPNEQVIKFAYFPMKDHNPGPVPIIFKFTVDAALFLL